MGAWDLGTFSKRTIILLHVVRYTDSPFGSTDAATRYVRFVQITCNVPSATSSNWLNVIFLREKNVVAPKSNPS